MDRLNLGQGRRISAQKVLTSPAGMSDGIFTFIRPQHVFKSFVPQLSSSPTAAPDTLLIALNLAIINRRQSYTHCRPSILKYLKPSGGAICRGRIGDFCEKYVDWAVMCTANCFICTGSISGLLPLMLGDTGRMALWRRGKITWCISTVTVCPATTLHLPGTPVRPLTLQRRLVLVTSVTGEFEGGGRTQ